MAFVEPLVEQVIEGVDADIHVLYAAGGPAAAEKQPGYFALATPPGSADPGIAAANGMFWKVWHDIFGGAAAHPNPAPLTQAQINERLSVIVGNLHAALQMLSAYSYSGVDYVQAQVTKNRADALSNLNGAVAAINVQLNALARILSGNTAAAQNAATASANRYTDSAVGAEKAARVAADNALAAAVAHAIADAASWSAAAENGAKAYTVAKVSAEAETRAGQVAALQRDVAQVVALLQAELATTANALAGQVANGVATSEAYARQLVPGTVALAVTDSLAAVQPQLARLAAEQDECLKPLCDTVTPNASQLGKLGGLLKGLEGLALPGLLLALVTEAVADPQAAAGQIIDATSWATDAALSLATEVIG